VHEILCDWKEEAQELLESLLKKAFLDPAMRKIAVTLNFRNHILVQRPLFVVLAGAALWLLFPDATPARAQSASTIPADTLAEIGPSIITAQDLIERIELMPWPGKERPGTRDSAKIHALQSLVAEELLAHEAAAAGLASDSLVLAQAGITERLLVRDELYRREVRAKVSVSEKEILRGLKRYVEQRTLVAFTARDRDAAREIARALSAHSSLDTAVRSLPLSLLRRQDTASVVFGQLEEPIEDVAYALTPLHRSSDPLQTPQGEWVVLSLLASQSSPTAAKTNASERRYYVDQTIRSRKELALARIYVGKILGPQKARATPEVFEELAKALLQVLRSDPDRYRTPKGYSLALTVDTLSIILAKSLTQELIQVPDGGMTLGEILNAWLFMSFYFPSLDEQDFLPRLNGSMREVVAAELMTRQGYRQSLHHSTPVRHDLQLWTKYWMTQVYRRQIAAEVEVTEEEVLQALVESASSFGRAYEVNIREILSDSLKTSLRMLERLLRGEDMAGLARRYSRRMAWAWRGGESGFFPVSEHPELGIQALEADTGKTLGPVASHEGYSLLRVLGKRQIADSGSPSFDSLKSLQRTQLRVEKGEEEVDRRLAAAARTQNVRLYYDRLKSVSIMPSNMVTTRSIGFGGAMKAFPPLTPQWEWMDKSADLRHLLP
jgi:hypothetical protein